jgi:hypothetical protein
VHGPLPRPPLDWDELADVGAAVGRFQGWSGAMWRAMSRLVSRKPLAPLLLLALPYLANLSIEFLRGFQVGDETLNLGIIDSEPR